MKSLLFVKISSLFTFAFFAFDFYFFFFLLILSIFLNIFLIFVLHQHVLSLLPFYINITSTKSEPLNAPSLIVAEEGTARFGSPRVPLQPSNAPSPTDPTRIGRRTPSTSLVPANARAPTFRTVCANEIRPPTRQFAKAPSETPTTVFPFTRSGIIIPRGGQRCPFIFHPVTTASPTPAPSVINPTIGEGEGEEEGEELAEVTFLNTKYQFHLHLELQLLLFQRWNFHS